ncbi:MAG: ABC transporter permease [Nocardioides sp.]
MSPEMPKDRREGGASVGAAIERYALPVLLLVLVVVFSTLPATSATFPTWANISNLLSSQSVLGFAAMAVLLPIVAGHYDLSVGAIIGASSILSAGLMTRTGMNPVLAILIAAGVACVIGLISGALIAYLDVHSLIVTTGTATVLGGLVLWYSNSATISSIPQSVGNVVLGNWFGVPKVFIAFLVIAVVVYVTLQHTTYGRYLHAMGANPRAAGMLGIRTRWLIISTFVLSALVAAAAGAMQLGLQGSASPQLGAGFTLPALSAVFLGSTAIKPGRFNVLGTVVAVYLVAVIVNGLTLAGASSWVEPTFNGLALLLAVSLSALVKKQRLGRGAQ